MAKTVSTMLPLHTKAPDFSLFDAKSQQILSLTELQGAAGTVIAFICNHCPFVKHILPQFINVAEEYRSRRIHFIAISCNDPLAYPEDAPKLMQQLAQNFPFAYLFDETQSVARAYQAACTPDFYLFDNTLACQYRGRFDASSPQNNIPVTGNELKAAMDALLSGKEISLDQRPSIGCSIKWRTT